MKIRKSINVKSKCKIIFIIKNHKTKIINLNLLNYYESKSMNYNIKLQRHCKFKIIYLNLIG